MKEKPMSALFTEKEEWGAWHKKNFTAKFAKSCFEGIYKTNEIGARDTSFQNIDTSKKTFILIGDSFAEGYGVNLEHTTQYILEKKCILDNRKLNLLWMAHPHLLWTLAWTENTY